MTTRTNGRKQDEPRPIQAKAGVIKNADGSAWFKIGNTTAYAAVYGPRELNPRFMQNPTKGIMRCNYNLLPFSGDGDRVRPGPSRRSKELSFVSQMALLPVVNLTEFPNTVVDVYIEMIETDAGSRCAGICAASIALADAGIPMKDMVSAISVGNLGDDLIVDLDGDEEHVEDKDVSDIPVAMIPSTEEITLLQMDGAIPKDRVVEALNLVKPVLKNIAEVQRKALKDSYNNR